MIPEPWRNLTSEAASNALPAFLAAVRNLPSGITSDDPFSGAAQPAQMAHLAPWTVELAGKVFAAILADVAAGKQPHQIVASVRAALIAAPAASSKGCYTKSRRLRPPSRP